tara:strand:+ start:345 stop:557 length:213 start_codon:yes stop_codon:yes gene_type:complete
MTWEDILKYRKIQMQAKTKIENIKWDSDREDLPDSQMVESKYLKDKQKVLDFLSKKYGAKALDYDKYEFF